MLANKYAIYRHVTFIVDIRVYSGADPGILKRGGEVQNEK